MGIAVIVGVVVGTVLLLVLQFQQRRPSRLAEPSGRTSLPSLHELRDDPRTLRALHGQVHSIYTASVDRGHALFLVDREGTRHRPSGTLPTADLEQLGRDLSRDLEVPYEAR